MNALQRRCLRTAGTPEQTDSRKYFQHSVGLWSKSRGGCNCPGYFIFRTTIMIDKEFIRRLRRFLLQFNDLRDFGVVGHDNVPRYAYTNDTLAYFRNNPGEAFR